MAPYHVALDDPLDRGGLMEGPLFRKKWSNSRRATMSAQRSAVGRPQRRLQVRGGLGWRARAARLAAGARLGMNRGH